MNVAYVLTTLGLVPYFASRAVLPVFLTALAVRFGPPGSLFGTALGVAPVVGLPHWATSDVSLWTLGVGSLVEAVLQRQPVVREQLNLSDAQLKTLLAVGMCLVLAPESTSLAGSSATLSWIGASTSRYAWAVAMGFLVWWAASNRRRSWAWLSELDEDDDWGFGRLFSLLEEALTIAGILLVVFLPLLAAGTALAAIASSWLLARALTARRENLEHCRACGQAMHPSAPHCPHCRAAATNPKAVGLLGQPLTTPAGDDHQHRLLLHKRCRFCATRLQGTGIDPACPACGAPPFSSRLSVDAYLAQLGRRTPFLLLGLVGLGLVPVFGLFVGILWYRVGLVGPIRQYAPAGARLFGRWLLRGVNGALLLLQPVPLLGGVVLPLMAMTNVWYYTRHVIRAADERLRAKDYSETLKR